MIEAQNLTMEYKIARRDPGLTGAIKSLFVRRYETKQAVKGINLKIERGEMVGYIGANGAGKSTTIKMLTGIMTPTAGTVKVNGIVPYENREANAKQIGAVFGQRTQLFWDIPVRESFNLLQHIYEVPTADFQQRLAYFTEVLDLAPLVGVPVRQLSLGQKMRCELAAAFLHNPAVVYLDEPTIGLDASVKEKIRAFIRAMNAQYGTTVMLTTHDMKDIEEICSRIIMIDQGQILYDGSLEAIKTRFGHKRVIHFELAKQATVTLPAELAETVTVLADEIQEGKVSLTFSNHQTTAATVIGAMMAQYQVRDLAIADPSIESIVKEIYERGL
jgi:ABC-2 type transport system ATP-binding protein